MTKRRNSTGGGSNPAGVEASCVGKSALRQLAIQHGTAAIAALAAVMEDSNATPAARVSAATALLGWGFGRSNAEDTEPALERGKERVVRLVWGGPRLGAPTPDSTDS